MPTPRRAGQTSERPVRLVESARRLVDRLELLVGEVTELRADRAELRRQARDVVAHVEAAVAATGAARRPGGTGGAPPRRRRSRRTSGRAKQQRATPQEVTSAVMRAVLVKLGEATASEIAVEITLAGVPISGRAVRFLAERAGAETIVGEDRRRRYRLG